MDFFTFPSSHVPFFRRCWLVSSVLLCQIFDLSEEGKPVCRVPGESKPPPWAAFYHSPEQRETAEALIRELTEQRLYDAPSVTELAPFTAFCPAEEYYRGYYQRNPAQPYCQMVITPKLAKFRQRCAAKLKS